MEGEDDEGVFFYYFFIFYFIFYEFCNFYLLNYVFK
jgi:hypothetical protein